MNNMDLRKPKTNEMQRRKLPKGHYANYGDTATSPDLPRQNLNDAKSQDYKTSPVEPHRVPNHLK